MNAVERSEEFIALVRRARQGRLKVFLGPIAGVGKTYRMLQEAHALRRQGVDVVIGIIETHGRPETAALLEGLEQVPLRTVEYRGVRLDELDVEAVIARAPEIVLVDEVAHTNAPGTRNRRRYEDVLEILKAGISVFCAFNVQHLEGVHDVVRRATRVSVRELVPDSFLARADQVVNIDLPAEDLLARMRSGRIYGLARAEVALQNFFTTPNIESLRELALREVADRIGQAQSRQQKLQGESRAPAGRLMAVIGPHHPHPNALLRKASKLAGRLNVHWFSVTVQTPAEAPNRIDAATHRRLVNAEQLARDLGAEVRHVGAPSPIDGILEFARSNGISDIVVGVAEQPWIRRLLGIGTPWQLLRRAGGFDLHMLDVEDGTT